MLCVLEIANSGGSPNNMSAYTVQLDFQNRFPNEPKLSMEEAAEGMVSAVKKGFIVLVGLEHLTPKTLPKPVIDRTSPRGRPYEFDQEDMDTLAELPKPPLED